MKTRLTEAQEASLATDKAYMLEKNRQQAIARAHNEEINTLLQAARNALGDAVKISNSNHITEALNALNNISIPLDHGR